MIKQVFGQTPPVTMRNAQRCLSLVGRQCGRGIRRSRQPLRSVQSIAPPAARAYSSGSLGGLKELLDVSEEVRDAVATNKPVVALESTIYTHGALGELDLEEIVRRGGGVPAVCGILAGVPTVGLSPEDIQRMVNSSPRKVSRRDIAFVTGQGMLGRKIYGGTTIAGTTILARLAGIRVFGTGGLGGVHRGGHESLDISADLTELGRTRMAVISSGCKGFLDIPRTLEYLETQGVLTATFADGRTGDVDFPAFWARDSGVKSPFVVQTEEEAAAMILAQENLRLESGLLFANPIPVEHSIDKDEMQAVIEQAVQQSKEQGAHGNENTPFMLRKIRELTDGRSVPANVALVQANIVRATKVAVAVSKMISGEIELSTRSSWHPSAPVTPSPSSSEAKQAIPESQASSPTTTAVDILVAGSVAVDLSCDFRGNEGSSNPSPQLHTSNPARISQSIGGVGRNVALAAHRVRGPLSVKLCSLVGNDVAGSTVLTSLQSCGMSTDLVRSVEATNGRTAQYVAVNDGERHLVMAMADMDIFATQAKTQNVEGTIAESKPKWLVVDANWSAADIRSFVRAGKRSGARVAFEPVSVAKSSRLFARLKNEERLCVYPTPSIDLATPNKYELASMYAAAQQNQYLEDSRWWEVIDALGMTGARDRFVSITSAAMTDAGIPQQTIQLLPYIPTIVTKLGDQGALLTMALGKEDPHLIDPASEPFILTRSFSGDSRIGGVYMRLFPAETVDKVVSVNGVGDTFLGVMVAGLARGGKAEELINVAQGGSVLTLQSSESVSEDLEIIESQLAAAVAV